MTDEGVLPRLERGTSPRAPDGPEEAADPLLGALPAAPSHSRHFLMAVWLAAAACSLLPPMLTALSIERKATLPVQGVVLTFFRDVNVLFMSVVSVPMLAVLILIQHRTLRQTLEQLCEDQVVRARPGAAAFAQVWRRRFRSWSWISHLIAVPAAASINVLTYGTTMGLHGHTWQSFGAAPGTFNTAGWLFFLCQNVPLYYLLTLLATRAVLAFFFLRGLPRVASVRVRPLHPDGLGGLRPVSRLGLYYQLAVVAIGVNLGSEFIVMQNLGLPAYHAYGILSVLGYLGLAVLAFAVPLHPFRAPMLESKRELLAAIDSSFQQTMDEAMSQLKEQLPEPTAIDRVHRIKALSDTVGQFPEWPFDMQTLKKFGTMLLTPALSVLLGWVLNTLLGNR